MSSRQGGVTAGVACGLAACLALTIAPAASPAAATGSATTVAAAPASLTLGSVTLHRCDVAPRAWCGRIERPWDPTGRVSGRVSIGFAWIPRRADDRPSLGVLVPHEGGPGYSTTGSAWWFAEMFGSLTTRRDTLLVDQRGTGRTEFIECRAFDDPDINFRRSVQDCAEQLGERFDLFGSALSADDLAGVLDALDIDIIDMYGDSYGTFFGQVFAGRHPERLRTLILDGAYPVFGESAWYPTQGPTMRQAVQLACARSPLCAAETASALARLKQLLVEVRARPIRTRAPGADGRLHRVTLDAATISGIAYNGTYLPPTYRELTAAVDAALDGDPLPLGRLAAEYSTSGESHRGRGYSLGADVAVSCQDYPQLFDMTKPFDARRDEYDSALRRKIAQRPLIFGPFTIREYINSGWSSMDMCLRWPTSSPSYPAGPPRPIGGRYPRVPTLVLSGEFDSITSPAEGAIVARQFPRSRQVVVANGTHVVGGAGPNSCGARLVRHMVRTAELRLPARLRDCAADSPAIRAVGRYPRTWQDTQLPAGLGRTDRRLVALTVANTAADVIDRWWQSTTSHGHGLRGGRWTSRHYPRVRLTLTDFRLVANLPVSGTVEWNVSSGAVQVDLHVPGTSGVRHVTGSWNAIDTGSLARLIVDGGAGRHRVTIPAP